MLQTAKIKGFFKVIHLWQGQVALEQREADPRSCVFCTYYTEDLETPLRRRGGQTPCHYLCFHTFRSPKSWRHKSFYTWFAVWGLHGPFGFLLSRVSSTGHYFMTPPGSWCSYWVLLSGLAPSTLPFWVQIILSLYPPVSFPYYTFWCLIF